MGEFFPVSRHLECVHFQYPNGGNTAVAGGGVMKQLAFSEQVEIPGADLASGLCVTCLYRPACGLRPRTDEPVVFCEEFCPLESSGPMTLKFDTKHLRPVAVTDRMPESNPWIGLCKSCANRHRCTLRKPAGGVWHCEEFA
jgi:hypothetical protein